MRRVLVIFAAGLLGCTGKLGDDPSHVGDGGAAPDAGVMDAGATDAAATDGGVNDAGDADAGPEGTPLSAQMTAPDADVVVMAGETFGISAGASGGTPPFTFTWTSTLDGIVATGPTGALSTLSTGDHLLQLTVTDAALQTVDAGTRSVHVLPLQFDWSHLVLPSAPPAAGDWMTPVKNQLTCGSCWSHAALGAMEAKWNIQNNNPTLDIDLSEQYLVDCNHLGAVGCGGGAPEQAIEFIAASGVPAETCDPFLGHNDACSATCGDGTTPHLYSITSSRHAPGMDHAAIQRWTRDALVHDGPIPRPMGGIYSWSKTTFTCSNLQGDHYVVLVGYDDTAGVWIARNSWGAGWNGNGYFKIAYGTCGMDASSISLGTVIPPP